MNKNNLSHKCSDQLDIIIIEKEDTTNTNTGCRVMRILIIYLIEKSILLRAPLKKIKYDIKFF